MPYFASLVQHGRKGAVVPRLLLVANNAFPVGNRRAKDLVSLRCVAGQAFKKATGLDCAPDLTPQQMYYGSLHPNDRVRMMLTRPPEDAFGV